MLKEKRILILGGGNMGEALIKGLIKASIPPKNIFVTDISNKRLYYLNECYKISASDNNLVIKDSDICILAVKPQNIDEVLREIREIINKSLLIISIAAGITLKKFYTLLPRETKLIRAMPNTPALVLAGITALAKGENISEKDIESTQEIFNCLGKSVWIDENLMDAVTGLSGSGPAYLFYFLESLIEGGAKMGLSPELARTLALQTVYGSVKLAMESDKNLIDLRKMVTSPGGTTQAGISELEKNNFKSILINTIEAATRRSKELGGI